mmetsp:Transcript_1257/g.2605  ORF Transcript_1257/g.2605 Transcript_1257/m.2605 type:complete len:310 (-) Transcript_1257:734-1663(-)|eukprot:CAMPEP_0114243940 /NCGR_PEP_ID=MMETSP0058-20121206/11067_1 /TAXON_ID=36894 /ORGANISM="Pyramimonas parkeae, CCMP726" /LENGTH=309 /DNA_ID=CAMNT_0001356833 /DNA_START=243 /DNA_END=1172 /DNA_ORIENTATION=-
MYSISAASRVSVAVRSLPSSNSRHFQLSKKVTAMSRPMNARVRASMGAGPSQNNPSPTDSFANSSLFDTSLTVQQTAQPGTLRETLVQAQALLYPGFTTTSSCVSCSPALTSAVLELSTHLNRTKEVSQFLRKELASACQMLPCNPSANLVTTTSLQLPSFLSFADRPAVGAIQGLGMMVMMGGFYAMMLASSFLFGAKARQSKGLGKLKRRNYRAYRMSMKPYPATRRISTSGRVQRTWTMNSSAFPTRELTQSGGPGTAGGRVAPYITGARMPKGRVTAPYMLNLLLQSDPPPVLRRYPALCLRRAQ